ncbi:MAG: ABC transporter permease [Alphaproteobacteria bacterium]|nr:ABC transporter permease [Alphaproteobacteria bacterium]
MLGFLTRRLAGAFLVLLLVSVLSFGIIWLVPGDPAAVFLDAGATPDQVERLRRELGLDKPLAMQVVEWYSRILKGDLGRSILLSRGVTEAIIERLPVTLSLAGISLVLSVVAGVAAGMVAATKHGQPVDQAVMAGALFGLSIPEFWLGLVLIVVFAVQLGVLPTGGFVPPTESITGWIRSITLPAIALAVVHMGFIARMTRAALLEVLSQDFIRTADSKGLTRLHILLRHGLPNALIPILTVTGIVAGSLLGGTVIIEQVFSIPGVGRLIIGAILSRDFPVIQGGLLFVALVYLTINLLVDICYAIVDPRVRLE